MAASISYVDQKAINGSYERRLFEIYLPATEEEAFELIRTYWLEQFDAWSNRKAKGGENSGRKGEFNNPRRGDKVLQRAPQFKMRSTVDENGAPVQVLFGEATKEETEAAAIELARLSLGLAKTAPVKPLRYVWKPWTESDGEPYIIRTNYPFKTGLISILRNWGIESVSVREVEYYLCRGLQTGRDGQYMPTFLVERHYELVLPDVPTVLETVGTVLKESTGDVLEEPTTVSDLTAKRAAEDQKAGRLPELASLLMKQGVSDRPQPVVVVFYDREKVYKSKVWPPVAVQDFEEDNKPKRINLEPLRQSLASAERLFKAKKQKIQTFNGDLNKAATKLCIWIQDVSSKDEAACSAVEQLVAGTVDLEQFSGLSVIAPHVSSRFNKARTEWETAYTRLSTAVTEYTPALTALQKAQKALSDAEHKNASTHDDKAPGPVKKVAMDTALLELPSLSDLLKAQLG